MGIHTITMTQVYTLLCNYCIYGLILEIHSQFDHIEVQGVRCIFSLQPVNKLYKHQRPAHPLLPCLVLQSSPASRMQLLTFFIFLLALLPFPGKLTSHGCLCVHPGAVLAVTQSPPLLFSSSQCSCLLQTGGSKQSSSLHRRLALPRRMFVEN